MTLADLTSREAVLQAMAEYDELGGEAFLRKYGFGESREYLVVHGGKRYDSKAILGAAHAFEHPHLGPLRAGDFNGEAPTTAKLRALGFDVEQGQTPAAPQRVAWVVRGGHAGQGEEEALTNGLAAIGWHELPDLRQFDSPEAMADALRRYDPERPEAKISAQKGQLHAFANEIHPGDLVLMPLNSRPGYVAIGRVDGDYRHRPDASEDTRHVRDVTWLATDVSRERLAPIHKWMDRPPTVSRIPLADAPEALERMLESGSELELPQVDLSAVLQAVMDELASETGDSTRLRQLIGNDGPAAVARLLGDDWVVKGRTGIGTDAHVPWIGIYLPDSEGSARSGFYAVYLFAADGSRVYLSLNQGTEQVRGGAKAIAKRTLDLRAAANVPPELAYEIDLRSTAGRPKKYEAASAAAVQYSSGVVPRDDTLEQTSRYSSTC